MDSKLVGHDPISATVRLSRRRVLRLGAGLLGGAAFAPLLSACSQPPAPAAKPAESKPADAAKPAEAKPAQQAAPAAPKDGASRMVIAYGSPAETMHPHRHYNTVTNSILQNSIYDSLTVRSADMKKLEPGLATEWKTLDERTWQFKLRPGVKFHDGTDFDAEVVKWNVDSILNPPEAAPGGAFVLKATFNTIDAVEIVDKTTVNMKTRVPDGYLDAKFSAFGGMMQSPKWFQDAGEEKSNKQAVGTGPYKWVDWVRDQQLVLEPNEAHWSGGPKVKNVVVRVIPETATRVAALKAGEVDIIVNVPPEEFDPIQRTGRATVKTVPSLRVMFAQLDTSRGPTATKEVRQALNYAVDVDSIVKNVMSGYGVRIATFLPDFFFAYDPELKPYTQDVNKAKELLSAAGYPNGVDVTFDIDSGRYPFEKPVAEALAGQLEKAGVRAKIQTNEWAAYNTKSDNMELGAISLWGWGNYTLDPDNSFYPRLRTPTTGKVTSLTIYSNKAFDDLIDQGRATADQTKRLAIYKQAQALLKDDCPYIFLYALKDIYGVSNRVEWEPRSDEFIWPSYASLKG